jgi:AraC-like DNA-binding protein
MTKGRAKLAMSQGVSLWVLEAGDGFGDADVHAHHAIQITLCLSGALSLIGRDGTVEAQAIAVAPDASHRIVAHGLLLFLFVEPESRAGQVLCASLFARGEVVALDAAQLFALAAPLRETFSAGLPTDALLATGQALLDALAPGGECAASDPRLTPILAHLANHPDDTLVRAAAATGLFLSPSRLRHLFVEQTGLPFKTYMVWLRLVRALQVYAQGQSLTEAAHAAGFADSAHFSRVFRRTFGQPATTLTRL